MRRAIQRCSASLPRTVSSLQSTSSPAYRCLIRSSAPCLVPNSVQVAVRNLNQSHRPRQEAAVATAESADVQDEADGVITRFDELAQRNIVHPTIVRTLTRDMGLETMTPVQSRTINETIRGTDVVAQAKTGTGKTLAFLIPILQKIISIDPNLAQQSYSRRGPRTTADDIRALIISPTRELAEQIAEEARKLVRNTSIIVQTAVGGTQKRAGLAAIQRQGCHILVGTPGRLKDILSDPYTRVEAPDLNALVFDEADRLLDQGFWPEIQEIMRLLPTPHEQDRQTMMFSATIPKEVVSLVRSTLKPGFNFVKCVQDDEVPTHEKVTQRVVTVKGLENALPTLVELCANGVNAANQPGGKPFKAIVYFNSTAEVRLASSTLEGLVKTGSDAADAFGSRRGEHPWGRTRIIEIHSKLSQAQRTQASETFRRAQSAILCSSDVTARGMDFPNVTHVIQVGLPSSREQYIHRIGRTARAGKEGEGWLILNQMEADEAKYRLKDLPIQRDTSLDTAALDLTREGQVPAAAGEILNMFQQSMRKTSPADKSDVYRAQIGVYGWFSNKNLLVQRMNDLAKYGWGMAQPPAISPVLAQRLGLSRAPGLNIGHDENRRSDMGRMNRGFGGDSFGERGGYRGSPGRSGDRYDSRDDFGGSRGRYDRRSDPFGRDSGRRDAFGDRPTRRSLNDDPFAM